MNTRARRSTIVTVLFLSVLFVAHGQQGIVQRPAAYEPSFGLLRDTLYVLDSTYLEVRLDQQAIYQHFRSGRVARYLCSTGDPRLEDGISTREGIYSIQWKSKKYMSQQFQVYLNYWMPFDGGIGFHGLQGRSYYRYLGRRASSHGCVRIANETGAKLFATAPRGTVVWVHGGSPARVLRFADSAMPGLRIMDVIDDDLLDARLDAVLGRRAEDSSLATPIALRPGRPFSGGIAVGRVAPSHSADRTLPLRTIPHPALVVRTERPEMVTAIEEPESGLQLSAEVP
jgi:hypothetical protein